MISIYTHALKKFKKKKKIKFQVSYNTDKYCKSANIVDLSQYHITYYTYRICNRGTTICWYFQYLQLETSDVADFHMNITTDSDI